MKKRSSLCVVIMLLLCLETFAGVRLIATSEPGELAISLRWNMVDYPGNTAYTLFKSSDGVVWTIAAANPVFRKYTAATVLGYSDHFSDEQRLYYRVKIYDRNYNIVEISNTATVTNAAMRSSGRMRPQASVNNKTLAGTNSETNGHPWQMYPNPVRDQLHLVYRGNQTIRGVINIIIQDRTGKTVIRFRAASKNKELQIPVNQLKTGVYFIRLNILNETQVNETLIKE